MSNAITTNTQEENRKFGYIEDGIPTDAQIELQDTIDNEIMQFLGMMKEIYEGVIDNSTETLEWDIEKISKVRLLVEELLNLPDVY